MFGEVGYIDIVLDENIDKYVMTMTAKTTGAAAALTGDRVETYTSEGKIIDKKYIPDTFVKVKRTNHKKRVQTYKFNHNKKEINLKEEKEKLVNHTSFDPISFKITEEKVKETSVKSSVLEQYLANDVLSSFINTTHSFKEQREYKLKAVGAHNDEKEVSLHLLDDLQKKEISSDFSNDIGKVCSLNVTPHDKNDTVVDILIGFDNNGNMKEAMLGDIFWIGKITAKRIYHKVICSK